MRKMKIEQIRKGKKQTKQRKQNRKEITERQGKGRDQSKTVEKRTEAYRIKQNKRKKNTMGQNLTEERIR